MKKKSILLSIIATFLTFSVSAIVISQFSNKSSMLKAGEKPETFDCEYFFNPENGYTSIYQMNQDLYSGILENTYITWGTVTGQYTYSDRTNTYIQSTDANGNAAAVLLYNCDTPESSYPIGSVVEVEVRGDNFVKYNNMPQIAYVENIELLYDSNPNTLIPLTIDSSNWKDTTDSSSAQFKEFESYGPRYCKLENVKISSVSSYEATATLGSLTFPLYYAYVGEDSSISSQIRSKLNSYKNSGDSVTIYGYVNAFINNYNTRVRILLRDPNAIVGPETPVSVSSIAVSNATTTFTKDSEFIKPTVTATYSDYSQAVVTDSCVFYGYDLSTLGSQTVDVSYTYSGKTVYTSYDIEVIDGSSLYTITLNEDNCNISSSYDTGSYGEFYSDGVYYQYYRAVGSYFYICDLLAFSHDYGDTLGGSFFNVDPIKNIKNISFTYSTTNSNGSNSPKLYVGEQNFATSYNIPYSSSENTFSKTDLSSVNYFKIDCGDTNLRLFSVTIEYLGTNTPNGSDFEATGMGVGQYRDNPKKYTGTLAAGSTSVTVPINVTYENGGYTVKETKTYTYYTYSYVENNPYVADDAAMITPTDVANYYSIFGEFPANYVSSSYYSEGRELFGTKVRQVSTYDRTTGYAKYVPWAQYESTGKPRYHEFDIDLTGDYASKTYSAVRGVGRVVAFESGYNVSSYGNGSYITCLFTDDHYATWQEFNNLGDFLPRFSVERKVTNRNWSEPTKISEN